MLTEQEVIDRLREAVRAVGGLRRFGEMHRFTAGYVHDVLEGKRAPADRILRAIGLRREMVYQEIERS